MQGRMAVPTYKSLSGHLHIFNAHPHDNIYQAEVPSLLTERPVLGAFAELRCGNKNTFNNCTCVFHKLIPTDKDGKLEIKTILTKGHYCHVFPVFQSFFF